MSGRQNNQLKKLLFVGIFLVSFFLSNLFVIDQLQTIIDNEAGADPLDVGKDENNLEVSVSKLSDAIVGKGVNQTVRLYMENRSNSINNKGGRFEIPAPDNKMYLNQGYLNFTFQSNFTADYIIEDYDAFNQSKTNKIIFKFNPSESASNLTLNKGDYLTRSGMNNLTEGINYYWKVNSTSDGYINFTVWANFTNQKFTKSQLGITNLNFNKTDILSLFYYMRFNISADANLTIRMLNTSIPSIPSWKNVTENAKINSSKGIQEVTDEILNKNIAFINNSNCVNFQFIFHNDTQKFNLSVFTFNSSAAYGFDVPITNQSQVALEFDLRGLNTTINGFYTWIRTLNLTLAQRAHLNISLYRSNRTILRSEQNLRDIRMGPDYGEKIYNYTLNFTGDGVCYFKFDPDFSTLLNVSNYFIVIKSNISQIAYSLLTIPYYAYGDYVTDHQLKRSIDWGGNWTNAQIQVANYPSRQLDASSFKINVTRGYMPSDFWIEGIPSLKIQNISLIDQSIAINNSSPLQWGIGQWVLHSFPRPIVNNSDGKFNITLTWNNTITNDFWFNVSFHVIAYRLENATSTYNVTYGGTPNWFLNYTIFNNNPKFDNWDFVEFWYIYPGYYTAHGLTTPAGDQIIGQTSLSDFTSDPPTKKIIVSNTIINITDSDYNGSYILNLTSYNCVYDMHSYINFKGNLIENKGFMYGDNISVRVDIQDHRYHGPINGTANVTLYKPNGDKYPNANLTQYSSIFTNVSEARSISYFDFDEKTILNITNAITTHGKYNLGFFWTNGSQIGCNKFEIQINYYNLTISNCNYQEDVQKNILQGTIKRRPLSNYSLLIGAVNETTGQNLPNFYAINKTNVNQIFTLDKYGQEFPVMIKSYLQQDDIINPEETVSFKLTVQNRHAFVDLNVMVSVRFVSIANEQWILAQGNSSTQKLNYLGIAGDTNEFSVGVTIPAIKPGSIWNGVNAPIRLAGTKAIVTVFVEGQSTGEYDPNEKCLMLTDKETEFEGHIISLKETLETSSASILKGFDRDETHYLPANTSYIINIYDSYYLSSYNQFLKTYTFKTDMAFEDIEINPTLPTYGEDFNISSVLTTEFGTALPGMLVYLTYNNSGNWTTLGAKYTNGNGEFTFNINTTDINIEDLLQFKLISSGGSLYLDAESLFEVEFGIPTNALTLVLTGSTSNLMYRNKKATFAINIKNSGGSSLKITNISVSLSESLVYSIVGKDIPKLNRLDAGISTNLVYEVLLNNMEADNLYINVTVEAVNLISNEVIHETVNLEFVVLNTPFMDYVIFAFTGLIIAIIALIYVLAFLYAKRIKQAIESPVEKPVKKQPRRGRYVKVSEIKPEPESEKLSKTEKEREKELEKLEPPSEKPIKEKSLDDLLEEKGLDEKK